MIALPLTARVLLYAAAGLAEIHAHVRPKLDKIPQLVQR